MKYHVCLGISRWLWIADRSSGVITVTFGEAIMKFELLEIRKRCIKSKNSHNRQYGVAKRRKHRTHKARDLKV